MKPIRSRSPKFVEDQLVPYEPKVGDRIRIIHASGADQYDGKIGTVERIDKKGQIFGTWGRLQLYPGRDLIEVIGDPGVQETLPYKKVPYRDMLEIGKAPRIDHLYSCIKDDLDMFCLKTTARINEEGNGTYSVKFVGEEICDFQMEGIVYRLRDRDFIVTHQLKNQLMVQDVLGQESIRDMMEQPVEIVTGGGRNMELRSPTLGDAMRAYGSDGRFNMNDTRRFARCPHLDGLIGPMYPNHGYIARYESSSAYNALSWNKKPKSERKFFTKWRRD